MNLSGLISLLLISNFKPDFFQVVNKENTDGLLLGEMVTLSLISSLVGPSTYHWSVDSSKIVQ